MLKLDEENSLGSLLTSDKVTYIHAAKKEGRDCHLEVEDLEVGTYLLYTEVRMNTRDLFEKQYTVTSYGQGEVKLINVTSTVNQVECLQACVKALYEGRTKHADQKPKLFEEVENPDGLKGDYKMFLTDFDYRVNCITNKGDRVLSSYTWYNTDTDRNERVDYLPEIIGGYRFTVKVPPGKTRFVCHKKSIACTVEASQLWIQERKDRYIDGPAEPHFEQQEKKAPVVEIPDPVEEQKESAIVLPDTPMDYDER